MENCYCQQFDSRKKREQTTNSSSETTMDSPSYFKWICLHFAKWHCHWMWGSISTKVFRWRRLAHFRNETQPVTERYRTNRMPSDSTLPSPPHLHPKIELSTAFKWSCDLTIWWPLSRNRIISIYSKSCKFDSCVSSLLDCLLFDRFAIGAC